MDSKKKVPAKVPKGTRDFLPL